MAETEAGRTARAMAELGSRELEALRCENQPSQAAARSYVVGLAEEAMLERQGWVPMRYGA